MASSYDNSKALSEEYNINFENYYQSLLTQCTPSDEIDNYMNNYGNESIREKIKKYTSDDFKDWYDGRKICFEKCMMYMDKLLSIDTTSKDKSLHESFTDILLPFCKFLQNDKYVLENLLHDSKMKEVVRTVQKLLLKLADNYGIWISSFHLNADESKDWCLEKYVKNPDYCLKVY